MSKIFIQIASYRDKQLIPTIKDLLQTASDPQNLTFGICWQHDETESLDEFKDDPRFRIIDIPYQDSKGCCWARNLTQSLYNEEKYTMQIDSHMRFIPNWDQECINMIEELKSKGHKKPMLTGYPPSFFPDNDPEKRMKWPIRVVFDKFVGYGAVNLKPRRLDGWEKMTSPYLTKYFSAGFYFTIGDFIKDVPYDPELFFRGEEITITVRAYTHGYDFFHPHKIILWHEYIRKGAPRNNIPSASKTSYHRTNVLLGLPGLDPNSIDFGIYGLGKERTFADYEEFSGIDFKNMNATKCIAMENNKKMLPEYIPQGTYLHVGCNTRKLSGYINVDVRETPATDIVANCWDISGIENDSVSFIYSRHMLEHISLENAKKTFLHWFNLLKTGGVVNIVVPDIEFHARQILGLSKSTFSNQTVHACAGFWGWKNKNRGGEVIDSHAWGYTFETLKKELKIAGFTDINRFLFGYDNEPWHLNVTARKPFKGLS